MAKGGLRRGNKADSNHLFTPKWRLGKTTAIRIPEIFKDSFLEIAKYLDLKPKSEVENINFIEVIKENSNLKDEINNLKNRNQDLQYKFDILFKLIEKQTNINSENFSVDKYQIALECFEEFVEKQGLDFDDLSKSRKATKKHQLWMIREWFENQKSNK